MPDHKAEERVALLVVGIASFLAPFMGSALNIALPTIGQEFSLSAVVLGWLLTSYLLAAAVGLLPGGRLADILGRRKIFFVGMAIYALAALLSACAPTAGILLVSRVINGIGAAMAFATGPAILISVVPAHRRGKALGWNVAAVYLGLALGPALGGVITHYLGWRWIFFLSSSAGFLTAGLTAGLLKQEWSEARGESFDIAGSLICGLGLVAMLSGLTLLPGLNGIALVMIGLLSLVLFVCWERRAPSPILDLGVFAHNPVFTFSNLAALINYAATAGVGFLLSLYLQYQKGLTAQQAGLVLVAQPLVMAALSPVSGRLSDRIEPGRLASAGLALTVGVLTALVFLRQDTSLGLIGAGLGVLGVSFALFSSPNMNAVMSSVARKHYGVAASTLAAMRLIGQSLSMGIVTLLATIFIGREQLQPENCLRFLGCARLAFGVFAVLGVFGVFASLARLKKE